MALHPLMEALVSNMEFKSVCEFGGQRFRGYGKFKTTKEFYASLGCQDYVALDVNDEHDATIADLNFPVDLGRTFDLVTNSGTGEHIFNQYAVFKNAHDLSHKYMLHVLPFSPWINHGFFNYNPILFRDLAFANSYTSMVCIGDRWGKMITLEPKWIFQEKYPETLEAAIRQLYVFDEQRFPNVKTELKEERKSKAHTEPFVIALFEKTDKTGEFKIPFQGKYQEVIDDQTLQSRYS